VGAAEVQEHLHQEKLGTLLILIMVVLEVEVPLLVAVAAEVLLVE
jgi:hypothetical protein